MIEEYTEMNTMQMKSSDYSRILLSQPGFVQKKESHSSKEEWSQSGGRLEEDTGFQRKMIVSRFGKTIPAEPYNKMVKKVYPS